MMGFEEFKERMSFDGDFAEFFSDVESLDEIVKVAQEKGYEFTPEELQDDSISDDMLEAVAGGKGRDYYHY